MKRKVCNFLLPNPFVVLSTKGLKRNNQVKYIIYPDLTKFQMACENCPYLRHRDKRFYCEIDDPDFMLRFYGLKENMPSGIFLVLGGVPTGLRTRDLGAKIESYLKRHSYFSLCANHPKEVMIEGVKIKIMMTGGKTPCSDGL